MTRLNIRFSNKRKHRCNGNVSAIFFFNLMARQFSEDLLYGNQFYASKAIVGQVYCGETSVHSIRKSSLKEGWCKWLRKTW